MAVLGWSPLLLTVVMAAVGLWPDPDPNPIGPGLLFFVTFWPALICLGIGGVPSEMSPGRPRGVVTGSTS